MIRFLNILALAALIGSATWAYSVKYETILVAEKLHKREAELQRERDAIAILKAEWHLLNRPERLQLLAKPEAGMQALSARQVVKAADVPAAVPGTGEGIDGLLTGSITPDSARKGAKVTSAKVTSTKATGGTTPAAARTPATRTSAPKGGAPKTATSKTAAARPAGAAPVRLVPPASVGSAPEKSAGGEGNPLTGFLKKLIR